MAKHCVYLLLLSAVFLPGAFLFAQDSIPLRTPNRYLKGSLFYDFPQSIGATAGFDMTIHHHTYNKSKGKGKIQTRHKDLIAGADLGFYRYPFNHTGLMIAAYIGKRRLYNNGTYLEKTIGYGALYTIYDGLTYSVDDNGTVKEQDHFYGRVFATVDFSLAFGIDLEKNANPKPFAIQLKPMLWFQFPYNGLVLPHGSLSLGVKYRIQRSYR